jgi:hypothetical protein
MLVLRVVKSPRRIPRFLSPDPVIDDATASQAWNVLMEVATTVVTAATRCAGGGVEAFGLWGHPGLGLHGWRCWGWRGL